MKEFDVYLREHLTECDIVVYSIPFRDGITAFDRMILECSLDYYLLQFFLEASADGEIDAHISDFLKTAYEALNEAVQIDALAEFSEYATIAPEAGVEITQASLPLDATVFENINSGMCISAERIKLNATTSLGQERVELTINSSVKSLLKNSIDLFEDDVEMRASLDHLSEQLYTTPSDIRIDIGQEISFVLMRYRKLSEVDSEDFYSLDNMPVTEIDYVTLI